MVDEQKAFYKLPDDVALCLTDEIRAAIEAQIGTALVRVDADEVRTAQIDDATPSLVLFVGSDGEELVYEEADEDEEDYVAYAEAAAAKIAEQLADKVVADVREAVAPPPMSARVAVAMQLVGQFTRVQYAAVLHEAATDTNDPAESWKGSRSTSHALDSTSRELFESSANYLKTWLQGGEQA